MMQRLISRRQAAGALGSLGVPLLIPQRIGAAESFTMRFGTVEPPAGAMFSAAIDFAKRVQRRSNGQIKVEVYPNNQLVNQAGLGDALVSGVLDFAILQASLMATIMPHFQLFDTPFLFKNMTAGGKLLDGPIGAELFAELEPKGMIGLSWGMNGFKQFETAPRAVVVPEDLKGMRMRIQAGAVYLALYQALGAIPIVIDVAESYVALQNHTVDGVDLSLDGFIARNLYTIVKHVSLSNHILATTPLIASKRKMEALPMPLQQIVRQEAKAIVPAWRAAIEKLTEEYIKTSKDNGVAISDIQYPAFRKMMDPVYAVVQSKLGGNLLERASKVANG